MCGIVGYLQRGGFVGTVNAEELARRMASTITHRGPDDCGTFADYSARASVRLCHLSIIDLSPAGAQPMVSGDGRWIIIFNGEIYNFEEMRTALQAGGYAPTWRGHSDSEVLLACIAAWGFEEAIRQTNGMFALALWDRRDRRLHLARDRMGEKPLYYGWQGNTFLFGSELKALAVHPAFEETLTPPLSPPFPSPVPVYRPQFHLPCTCASSGRVISFQSTCEKLTMYFRLSTPIRTLLVLILKSSTSKSRLSD